MTNKTLRIRGYKDPVSGLYLWDGLVIIRDGVCWDAAPVWGTWIGKPLEVIMANAKDRDYLVEEKP